MGDNNDLLADIQRAREMVMLPATPSFAVFTQNHAQWISLQWGVPAEVCDVCGCTHFNPAGMGRDESLCFSCERALGRPRWTPSPLHMVVLDEVAPAPPGLGLRRRQTYREPLPADRKRWWDK